MPGASGAITAQKGSTGQQSSLHGQGDTYNDTSDTEDVRYRNMTAAKAIADIVRTSLGPRQQTRTPLFQKRRTPSAPNTKEFLQGYGQDGD